MLHFRRIAMGASKPAAPGFNIENYLTIEALEDGMTVSLSVNACEYCIDGSDDWVALPAATATPAVNTGQTLSFKATGLTPTSSAGIGTFSISKKCNLKGNCMSMIYGDNAQGKTTISNINQFKYLFQNGVNIIEVSRGFLPATTLAGGCYSNMFRGCTSLTTASELPVTTLADYCCEYMYYGCTSLTAASALPATSMAVYCYRYMYAYCQSLAYIKAMFLSSPLGYATNWVLGVSATGTFVKNAAAKWDVTGVDGIPAGWTVELAES